MSIRRLFFLPGFAALLLGSTTSYPASRSFIPADNPAIRYSGRVDRSHTGIVRFDWPGFIMETSFDGTSISVTLGGSNEYYDVCIDTVFTTAIKTDTAVQTYTLAENLTDTLHHLTLIKRFETDREVTTCKGVVIDAGHSLHPSPPVRQHFIEFIGASTIMGYGNESKTTRCDSLAKVSNVHRSFGPVAARLCNADYTMCAKTRAGIVRNYNARFFTSPQPFPTYYHRTLLTDPQSGVWHYPTHPDIIVINLGMNDYSTLPHPPKALFINHYFAFTQELYALYPAVYIICTTSWREPVRAYVKEFVTAEQKRGNHRIDFFSYEQIPDWRRGCDWHPNAKAHQAIGEELAKLLQRILSER